MCIYEKFIFSMKKKTKKNKKQNYIKDEVYLLFGQSHTVRQCHCSFLAVDQSTDVTQPNFKKSNFDQDQLIVLTQFWETYFDWKKINHHQFQFSK